MSLHAVVGEWCRLEPSHPPEAAAMRYLKESTLAEREGWDADLLVRVLLCMARMGIKDKAILKHLAAQLTPAVLMSAEPGLLAAAAWAFAVGGLHGLKYLSVVWLRLSQWGAFLRMTSADIALCIWAMGEGGQSVPRVVDAFMGRVFTPAVWLSLGATSVAYICRGLARLQVLNIHLMGSLAVRLLCGAEYLNVNTQALVDLVWASSRVGFQEPWFIEIVQERSRVLLPQMTAAQCVLMLRAATHWPTMEAGWAPALAQQALHRRAAPEPKTVLEVCQAAAIVMHDNVAIRVRLGEWVQNADFLSKLGAAECAALGVALLDLGPTLFDAIHAVLVRATTLVCKRTAAAHTRTLLMVLAHLPERYHAGHVKDRLSRAFILHLQPGVLDRMQTLDMLWALGTVIPSARSVVMGMCNYAASHMRGLAVVTAAEVSCTAWCMARNQCRHPGLLMWCADLTLHNIELLTVDLLAALLWSFARLGVRNPEILRGAAGVLEQRVAVEDKVRSLACVLWVYAIQAMDHHGALFERICDVMMAQDELDASVEDLSVMLWALHSLAVSHPGVLGRLAPCVARAALDDHAVCNAVVLYAGVDDAATLEALGGSLLNRNMIPKLTMAALQNVRWAYEHTATEIGAAVLQEVEARMEQQCVDLTAPDTRPFLPAQTKCTALPCAPPAMSVLAHWVCITM